MEPGAVLRHVGPPSGRPLTVLALIAGILTALLTGLQLHLGNQEQRVLLDAASRAVELSASIGGSGPPSTFATQSRLAAIDMAIRADARRLAALDAGAAGPILQTQAQADQQAAEATATIGAAMAAPPGATVLDARTRATITAQKADWEAEVALSNQLVGRANRFGDRATVASYALFLAALASILFGLAGELDLGNFDWLRPYPGGLALCLSVALGVVALLP
jgi:hypothetical protein